MTYILTQKSKFILNLPSFDLVKKIVREFWLVSNSKGTKEFQIQRARRYTSCWSNASRWKNSSFVNCIIGFSLNWRQNFYFFHSMVFFNDLIKML